MPRSDGNCIEFGDFYRLCYWRDGSWRTIGEKTATNNDISFTNVPSNGLYLLANLTKGKQQRIFTYQNGKQIWW